RALSEHKTLSVSWSHYPLRFILQLCLAGLALFILVQLAKLYARHKHVDLSASRRSPLTHPKNEG
ncbi:hypothetical protein UQ93_16145, partial [Shigella dysenteriae]